MMMPLLVSAESAVAPPLFVCGSNIRLGTPVAANSQKGLCLDDTTFAGCPWEVPTTWPNTGDGVKSLRLFSAWRPEWGGDEVRENAWTALQSYVDRTSVSLLVGTQVTCDAAADDAAWLEALQLVTRLGADRVMGVAVGNEVDITYQKAWATQECIADLFSDGHNSSLGRHWKMIQRVAADMDAAGLSAVPVTTVWATAILTMQPFLENPLQANAASLLRAAHATFGPRWIWSFNIYGIWDFNLKPDNPETPYLCAKTTGFAASRAFTMDVVISLRKRMYEITGHNDDTLWIGEMGWSSPQPDGLASQMQGCPGYCSLGTFRDFYFDYLSWDLSMGDASRWGLESNIKGPDHAFYFAMRNSMNGPSGESFGLIGNCGDALCKITADALNESFTEVKNAEEQAAIQAARLVEQMRVDEQLRVALIACSFFALGAVCMLAIIWRAFKTSDNMRFLKLPLVSYADKNTP